MAKPHIQIGDISREMNDAEYAQWQTDKVEAEAQAEAQAAKAETKASALAKLGLTADEAAALFG
jgi:hypothetical protein